MKDIETLVINATIELMTTHGISELKTAKIAKSAGTSETVIYRHFKNKQDIIKQTVFFLLQGQLQKFEAIKRQPLSAQAKLEALLTVHLNYNENTKGLSRLAFSDQIHLGDMELKQIVKNYMEEYEDYIKEILQTGREQGEFRDDLDIKAAAQSYIASIYFVINKWSLEEFSWNLLAEKDHILQYWVTLWNGKKAEH